MSSRDVKRLLNRLNAPTVRALESAANACIRRTHYEVRLEHLLAELLAEPGSDLSRIFAQSGMPDAELRDVLEYRFERLRSGNTGRPALSPMLVDLVESAWTVASIYHGSDELRSGHLVEAFLESDRFAGDPLQEAFEPLTHEALRAGFDHLTAGSYEAPRTPASDAAEDSSEGGQPVPAHVADALERFTIDLTSRARAGEIDPIFGRDGEIRQVLDILGRRRKNNAILVGEAGVGKTAVVEGLALRIVQNDVPDALQGVEVRTLDLGALQAGAGVKGEFENRLKDVLRGIREAATPTLLFIDEAHTLIGAGGQAGTGDAANLLKPALARGELRTIAATTWAEYKKHIEKDPALERRFQLVKVEEPTADVAAVMLRGLKSRYEAHHGVVITAQAVRAMAVLADRYISGRQLPDKAVDLMDTAAARVRMSQSAKPAALDDAERRIANLDIEIDTLRADLQGGLSRDHEALQALEAERALAADEREHLDAAWQREHALVERVVDLRARLRGGEPASEAEPAGAAAPPSEATEPGDAEQTAEAAAASSADPADLLDRLQAAQDALAAAQGERPLVYAEVDTRVVARVVADWTGIPAGTMLKDEALSLLRLEEQLAQTIKGQDEAVGEVASALRASAAGLSKPDAPLGVFLFVGPSGVGKTEMARALSEQLFGGERFLTTINMSEYQEAHTVSQLKGSPPGYVGYGEGGVLTEAVRQRPYSVVLLDEAEKAHLDAMELFYQVFDRGMMRDGEGREIDFRNTVLILTSNIGSERFLYACTEDERPTPDQLRQAVHPLLVEHFRAALLGRMRVVPFYPLRRGAMAEIARVKLGRIGERLEAVHGVRFEVVPAVIDEIVARSTRLDAGARDLDALIERTVLPEASKTLLAALADEHAPQTLVLALSEAGAFALHLDPDAATLERLRAPRPAPPAAEPEAGEGEAEPTDAEPTDAEAEPAPTRA